MDGRNTFGLTSAAVNTIRSESPKLQKRTEASDHLPVPLLHIYPQEPLIFVVSSKKRID